MLPRMATRAPSRRFVGLGAHPALSATDLDNRRRATHMILRVRLVPVHSSSLSTRLFFQSTSKLRVGLVPLHTSSLSTRLLPQSMDEVRGLTPQQLEDARLSLKHALDDVERTLSDEERCTANRILGGALLRLGSTFEAEERLEQALAFEEAAHGDPRSTASGREIIFMLGVVYQRTERVEDAIHSFETVMEADDSHWRSKFHLATMAVKSQMYADARVLLEQVLRDEPDHHLSLQILGKLDELDACKNEGVADPE